LATEGSSSSGNSRISIERRAVSSISSASSPSGSAPNWRASDFSLSAGPIRPAASLRSIASSILATDFSPSSRK
jgi:hypothetical protein